VASLSFEKGVDVDLSRLNEAERHVLRLLAEGHTAKSVANELGSTPAAVNERLREARRKTSVGSSRELARLLKSQENCHDEMGMGRVARPSAVPVPLNAPPRRPGTGVLVMILMTLTAVAGAAAFFTQQPKLEKEVDPLIGSPLTSAPDPAALHARVRAEPRDANWAPRIEAAIRARTMQIPLIGKNGNTLRVTCAVKLCEIAGSMKWSMPPREYDPKLPESRAQQDLQSAPYSNDLAKLGLKFETALFTGSKEHPDQMVFLLYYSRTT
jgi:DNA-binding CsgD family transcriptional regulator